jgi:ABC-type sugar transport system permease subunit
MGYAASLSILFFAVSVIIAMIVFRWGRSWVNYDV